MYQGDFREVRADCLVSPANSYGRMDGSLDALTSERLPRVQLAVSQRLARQFSGYQPVGTCAVVPSGDLELP